MQNEIIKQQQEETISAVCTALGEGAIGIVRISGERALACGEQLFRAASGKALGSYNPNTLVYGHVVDEDNAVIDEVMAVYMRAPHSYTAEDVVEIQCHGSVRSLQKILSLSYAAGARPAEPGEFTKRAFLNGRIDLVQAEAVMDIIKSRSDAALKVAVRQQEGQLSSEVRTLRRSLLDVIVNLEAVIDYPEDDIEEITFGNVLQEVGQTADGVKKLLANAHTGKILREGLHVAIIGKPNVGKSSFLNFLLKEDRAIVSAGRLYRNTPARRATLLKSSLCWAAYRLCWQIPPVSAIRRIMWSASAWKKAAAFWKRPNLLLPFWTARNL